MKEVLSLSLARKIKKLLDGERVSSSTFHLHMARELAEEEVLVSISRGSRVSYQLKDPEGLRTYLAQHYDIDIPLEDWIEIKTRGEEVKRSEQVQVTGNSKSRSTRVFKGFLINSCAPIIATLREETIVLHPMPGASVFIEDYEHFSVSEDVIIVGMENGENFQHISDQQYLFEDRKVLFVSRYPQSKDLRTWLQSIPNRYIHFGDFDLAGIHIFLSEFYAYLGDRAEFLIPDDVEQRIASGSRMLYDTQYAKYKEMEITDKRLQSLVEMIHRYRRGYEQEGYIKE